MDVRCYRARTFSLYSTASGTSSRSSLSLTTALSPPTSPAPRVERGADAWGSFVPLAPARQSLQRVISSGPPSPMRTTLKQRPEKPPHDAQHVFSLAYDHSTRSPRSPSRQIRTPASAGLPVITRTSSPSSSPSVSSSPGTSTPSSSASSINLERKSSSSSELHPVLAKLERTSKLCGQKMACATCHTPGRDYPQCGKCKKMWCSRECRIVGGKRHIC